MPGRYIVAVMTERQEPEKIRKEDAAAMLGVCVRTLERYVAAGRIAPLPLPMYPRYFKAADVVELQRTGRVEVSA